MAGSFQNIILMMANNPKVFFNYELKYIAYIENSISANHYTTKKNSKIYLIGKCPIEIKGITNLEESDFLKRKL